jgi:hypothetical protein
MAEGNDDDFSGSTFDPMSDAGAATDPAVGGDSFTEVTSQSWGERLMGAIVGVLVGIVLILGTAVLLFWNEGRAVQTARSLTEGAGVLVEVDSGRVDSASDGKLIHVAGNLQTGAKLVDPEFGVDAQAARLVREAATYQWKETSHSSSQKKLGGGEETVTTYTYARVWSDAAIDSSRFRQPSGHQNPSPRYKKLELAASDARLGAFTPSRPALEHLSTGEALPVDPAILERIRPRLGQTTAVVSDGAIYIGHDPSNSQLGDSRISYRIAPVGPASFIGRQSGADITPFQTQAGDRLLMASSGIVPADSMFKSAQLENKILTWAIRIVGLVMMWVAWFFIFRPIAVVGDVVPLIGSVLAAGAGLASFVITAALGPLIIAIAWFFYRPLVGLAILAGGLAVAFGVRMLGRKRRAGAAPGPIMAGQTARA